MAQQYQAAEIDARSTAIMYHGQSESPWNKSETFDGDEQD